LGAGSRRFKSSRPDQKACQLLPSNTIALNERDL
jgi:hypothetical protein